MAAPVIYCFGPVPPAAVQTFLVPAVPTANAYYEQQCVMYPAGEDQQLLHSMQTCYHSAGGLDKQGYHIMDSTHSGCVQQARRIGQRDDRSEGLHQYSNIHKNRKAFASAFPYFDEPEDKNVSVVFSNLPKMLRSKACFEVALDAALLKDVVVLFALEQTEKGTEAVVILKTEAAAQTLMKHFRNMNCGPSGGVIARYCEERGNKLLSRMTPKDERSEADIEERAPLAETFPSSRTTSAGNKASISVPLVLTQTSLKMRWADYEDDCDSDYEIDAQSSMAGVAQSSSELAESNKL